MAGFPETYSYTGDQLAAQVEQKFGDTGGVQISRAMQLGWINNGIRAIAQQNPPLEGVFQIPLLANTPVYDLKALMTTQKVAQIVQIVVSGRSIDLIDFPEFQATILNAQQVTDGTPVSVPIQRPTVGAIFADQLSLWPTPGKTIANGIAIYYRSYPADLTAITDKLTVPDRFYNALFDYVMAQALELNTNWDASQIKLAHFQAGVQREYEKGHAGPADFYSGMVMDPYDDDAVYNPGSF